MENNAVFYIAPAIIQNVKALTKQMLRWIKYDSAYKQIHHLLSFQQCNWHKAMSTIKTATERKTWLDL